MTIWATLWTLYPVLFIGAIGTYILARAVYETYALPTYRAWRELGKSRQFQLFVLAGVLAGSIVVVNVLFFLGELGEASAVLAGADLALFGVLLAIYALVLQIQGTRDLRTDLGETSKVLSEVASQTRDATRDVAAALDGIKTVLVERLERPSDDEEPDDG